MNARSIAIGFALVAAVTVVIVAATNSSWLQQLNLFAQGKPNKANGAKSAQPPAQVIVKTIELRNVTPRQIIVGTIKPRRISTIGSAASGRVDAFLVNDGEPVKKGQKIAQLKTAIIEAERAVAEATYKAVEAELIRLQKALPEEIKQAEAKLAMHTHLEKFRTAQRIRSVSLGQRQAISQEELDQIISLESQAKSSRLEAEAALAILSKTKDVKILEAKAKKEAAHAEFQRLDEQRKRHSFYAPFDGYVVKEHTEAGEWVLQGAPVVTIAELSYVEIEVPVLEDYISFINEKDTVLVEVPALPQDHRAYQGEIAHIVPQANAKTQTFPVKIWVKNQPVSLAPNQKARRLLMAEMLARVRLPAGFPKKGAIMAPLDAINLERNARTIFVVIPDPNNPKKSVAKPISVKLGVSDGNLIEVFGDVLPGQLVVVEGNERLRPFQEVQIIEAASRKK